MQQLIELINKYAKPDPETIASLGNLVIFENYSRNQHILREGQICNKVWFVKSGMVRKYHLDDGKEITSWIHFENEMITSLDSYFNSIPSHEYLQACEETCVISITKQNSEKLGQHQELAVFINRLFGEQLAKIDAGSVNFKAMNATDKYKYLQSVSPQLFKRAKLGQIASIMGISQETLSRIRKQC